ncbi:hypothetical protein [Cellulomonas dongxiuzhuiae]|uniref:hypothetical protein n=1 Tax=Cellulomonas dongxiuzhuiae TaxID=2819979 RepID=UPI001AAFB16E|nr:hypothetical protein [Cellulomonas dongxiuzhuiae]MBO3089489.1 hypothetical protein [Cellulomonas dongxiuzhuiae]
MAVDDDRRRTAGARRARLIESFTREFDVDQPTSTASRFRALLDARDTRPLIVSGDIDGMVSASMLARVAPGWRAVALIVKSETVLVHPDFAAGPLDLASCFGVDVFSSYFPSVSNHVPLWGAKKPGGSALASLAARAHDLEILRRADEIVLANPSLWARIEGSYDAAAERPFAAGYRYPLGTAQIMLALLEVVGKSPRMFDRDYLPWLVANCDGGLQTIRDYPYNVPMWWASMAAAVGPASLSEKLYQLAMNQRPTEFVDVVNRLRAEGYEVEGAPARFLDDKWNLRSTDPAALAAVSQWITSLSGWPDPFLDGAERLPEWAALPLPNRGALKTTGLPHGASVDERLESFRRELRSSLNAVHTNFAYFDQAQQLNWVGPWDGAQVPALPELPSPLLPNGGVRALLSPDEPDQSI